MKVKSPLLDFKEQWQQENEEVKFDLFVQSRRAKQLRQALMKVIYHQDRNQGWLKQNVELVDDLLDQLLQDSMLALDGVEIDKESVDLSAELISNIKETVNLIHHLAHIRDRANH